MRAKHDIMKHIHMTLDRYQSANGSFEIRIPTASIESVIGTDGANISEIRKVLF
jgi:ribosomal protein S3